MARPRKHRHWSDEEKRSICCQSKTAGISVAQVARRYAMNANLIFKWLNDPRYAPDNVVGDTQTFLPVEIEANASADRVSFVEAPAADDPDNEYAMIDATIVRAHQHSAGAHKKGVKIKP